MAFDATSQFGIVDYVVFAMTLVVSSAIGLFYACSGGKQSTSSEYLLADRKMHPIPVAISTVASFVSAIAVTGVPAEIYTYGTVYLYYALSAIGTSLFTGHVYLPVFYRLQLTSVYEYLQLRFNRAVRLVGVVLFCIQTLAYMAIVLYAPSLALSAVTGLNVWLSVACVGAVGTFYTALGGIKAVVWTDVFQTVIMVAGMLTVLVVGSIQQGGFSNVWDIAMESGRLDFLEPGKVFNLDPTIPLTFWSLIIGGTLSWTATYAANQTAIQRCLAVSTLKGAQISLWLNVPGMFLMTALPVLCGLVIYARYALCDPLASGQITSNDQLFPLYVMDVLGYLPGVPGLFVAALFSASLSTVSSGLNALASVILEDVVKVFFRPNMNDKTGGFVSRIIATVFGAVCIGLALVFVSTDASDVVRICMSLFSVIGGPLLALFSLGMFFPWANWKGALTGFVVGFGLVCWINFGAMAYPTESFKYPTSTVGCYDANSTFVYSNTTWNANFTIPSITTTPNAGVERPPIAKLYELSYMWYSCVSWLTVIVVGLVVSFITGHTKIEEVDPALIVPFFTIMCPCVPNNWWGKYSLPNRICMTDPLTKDEVVKVDTKDEQERESFL